MTVIEIKNQSSYLGYCKPPQSHQFKPGQSGNPQGRPKGARNFKTELREELSELITVREGDGEILVSKQRALIKQIVSSALAGDARAIMSLMTVCIREFGNVNDFERDPEDELIIKAVAKRKHPAARKRASASLCAGGAHEG